MPWSIESAQSEDLWFQDYLKSYFEAAHIPSALPPTKQVIGSTEVTWEPEMPGYAVIQCHGGTIDDRLLAEWIVREDLAAHGFRQKTFEPPKPLSRKLAAWPDVMQKAMRLIQSGNVTLLRNGSQNVVAHVIGDHGEYDVEIMRQDPSSRTISQWNCECPWAQYAFGRTRQFKKFEARPCAHTLATYWKSLTTPLDDAQPQTPGGYPGPPPGAQPSPAMMPGMGQPQPLPQGSQPGGQLPIPPMAPELQDLGQWNNQYGMSPMPPSQSPPFMVPPGQGRPTPAPQQQGEQLAFQFGQNGVIPPFPGAQGEQMVLPISVPGGRPGPYPANPIQFPGGTFSSLKREPWEFQGAKGEDFQNAQMVRLDEDTSGRAEGPGGGNWMEIKQGQIGEVLGVDPNSGMVEVIFPLNGPAMTPYHVRCFVEPSKLTNATWIQAPGGFIQRA